MMINRLRYGCVYSIFPASTMYASSKSGLGSLYPYILLEDLEDKSHTSVSIWPDLRSILEKYLASCYSSKRFFFFRNGVFPASASIDAHNRFIKNV
jgi:hypothetical protein